MLKPGGEAGDRMKESGCEKMKDYFFTAIF